MMEKMLVLALVLVLPLSALGQDEVPCECYIWNCIPAHNYRHLKLFPLYNIVIQYSCLFLWFKLSTDLFTCKICTFTKCILLIYFTSQLVF